MLVAVFYLVVTIFLMNYRLVFDTLFGDYDLSYKMRLLFSLLAGMQTAMTFDRQILLVVISILTGANLALLGQRLLAFRKLENVHFAVGGTSLLGLASSGCAACGLPLLSLLGLTGSLAFLPLRGLELAYLSLILLVVSFYLLVKSYKTVQACAVN